MSVKEVHIHTAQIKQFSVKYRQPHGEGPFSPIVLLHGWTGDENSMWIFSSKLPEDSLLIAPRAIFPNPGGGFSWYENRKHQWPNMEEFSEAIEALDELLTDQGHFQINFDQLRVVGFSQGAALAYCYAFRGKQPLKALAGLSGFLPEGAEKAMNDGTGKKRIEGMPIFIAHGTKDQIVPVNRARAGIQALQQAGANVIYCEDDVGHKLSASCFRGMQNFFLKY